MIVHLTGKFTHKSPTHTVIDVGGVGYEVKISLHTFSTIKTWETGMLLVHQYIKGDIHTLYGFASVEEKYWFLHLINVNSVGPRTAMTVLSSLNPLELKQAIMSNQVGVLKSIKGIGDKAAQRIVLELKDKLTHSLVAEDPLNSAQRPDLVAQEALTALMKLGISRHVAEKAIVKTQKEYPEELPLETLIRRALQVA